MTYKEGDKIRVNTRSLLNPEDWFNDLIRDDFSVEEALSNIIQTSIVISKVNDILDENGDDSLYCGGSHSMDDNGEVYEVTIEKDTLI
jgi:hypothetical protein